MTWFLLVAVLAGPKSQPGNSLGLSGASPYTHVFANKSRLELVAISDSKFTKSWKPDGSPIAISKAQALTENFGSLDSGTLVLLRLTVMHSFDRRYWVPMDQTH